MQLVRKFQPVSLLMESEEELIALRDACFGSNNPLAIKLAKDLNALLPRKRGPVPSHRKIRNGAPIETQVLQTVKENPNANLYGVSVLLPSVNKQSISAALTKLHQSGLVLRTKNKGGYEYAPIVTD